MADEENEGTKVKGKGEDGAGSANGLAQHRRTLGTNRVNRKDVLKVGLPVLIGLLNDLANVEQERHLVRLGQKAVGRGDVRRLARISRVCCRPARPQPDKTQAVFLHFHVVPERLGIG